MSHSNRCARRLSNGANAPSVRRLLGNRCRPHRSCSAMASAEWPRDVDNWSQPGSFPPRQSSPRCARVAAQSNQARIAPRAALRRSDGTRSSSWSDEVGALQGAIRARDVRAADLQEEPMKRLQNRAALRHDRFGGSDEDGGSQANIAASGASNGTQRAQRAEQSNPGRIEA